MATVYFNANGQYYLGPDIPYNLADSIIPFPSPAMVSILEKAANAAVLALESSGGTISQNQAQQMAMIDQATMKSLILSEGNGADSSYTNTGVV